MCSEWGLARGFRFCSTKNIIFKTFFFISKLFRYGKDKTNFQPTGKGHLCYIYYNALRVFLIESILLSHICFGARR